MMFGCGSIAVPKDELINLSREAVQDTYGVTVDESDVTVTHETRSRYVYRGPRFHFIIIRVEGDGQVEERKQTIECPRRPVVT